MQIDEYQRRAGETAVYPGRGFGPLGLAYVMLGFVNEVGEYIEKRDEGTHSDAELLAEAGDALWYAAEIAGELIVPLSDLLNADDWADLVYMRPGRANEEAARDHVWKCLARAAGHVKKVIRDDVDGPSDLRVDLIRYDVRVVVSALATLVGGAAILEGAAEGNLAKLADRMERDAIHGDGDHR